MSNNWSDSSSLRCFSVAAQPVECRGMRGPTRLTRGVGAASLGPLLKRLRSAFKANGVFPQVRLGLVPPAPLEHLPLGLHRNTGPCWHFREESLVLVPLWASRKKEPCRSGERVSPKKSLPQRLPAVRCGRRRRHPGSVRPCPKAARPLRWKDGRRERFQSNFLPCGARPGHSP
jgi:hypothetical protein